MTQPRYRVPAALGDLDRRQLQFLATIGRVDVYWQTEQTPFTPGVLLVTVRRSYQFLYPRSYTGAARCQTVEQREARAQAQRATVVDVCARAKCTTAQKAALQGMLTMLDVL